ncbi:TetR/AcrR family transcriptional regulator [Nicoliella spurrieriana]|uniref:TetR/AcrR family transcriptional regulator n=1 Tax=Nicoliella spurrieriana TaxID=2925830 RepID=A0A976RT28_9LACO|nr:TetR/AcrR family transcriptional regulator [Nicoliella spurrieriana]UQS87326.1 TetR/AcrR family transcriptional regulator [Nicoliella spurrieriana]
MTLKLLSKKPLNRISINEITAQAKVNRSTFYRYFVDKEALVEFYENQIIARLEAHRYKMISDFQKSHSFFADENVRNIIQIFADDKEQLQILLNPQSKSGFDDRLAAKMIELVRNSLMEINPNLSLQEANLLSSYHANGIVGIIKLWINNPQYNNEQVIAFTQAVTSKGILGLF